MSGWRNLVSKVLIDAVLLSGSWVLAFYLRFDGLPTGVHGSFLWNVLPLAVALKLLVFSLGGVYRSVWRYSGVPDLVLLARAVILGSIVLAFLLFLLPSQEAHLSRGVWLIDAVLSLFLTGGVRIGPRLLRESLPASVASRLPTAVQRFLILPDGGRPTLVVGAGDAGETVLRLLTHGEVHGYRPVAVVDDDRRKLGLRIHGITVRGTTDAIERVVKEYRCEVILVAIPSASVEALRRIAAASRRLPVETRVVPDLKNLLTGRMTLSDIRELDVEALLGREKVDLQIERVAQFLQGRRVLVTGAGGSIGSELCRQILPFGPAELILFGRGENSIFEIYNELYRTGTASELHQVIGDVINKRKLQGVFERFRPDIVFHAAADKHVPLMELNPDEAVLNNILGTRNLLEVCDHHRTQRVVCISTDKAVNPTSVMGCCKRVAELLVQNGSYGNTKAVAVRFGNVLGSRGSVMSTFARQIETGGPVTVTDANVERYFMTIPEAVQLVILAGAMAAGGEIFLLEMGEPVPVRNLARQMILMRGYKPEVEIPIRFTGLRPGEKLREELVVPGESTSKTDHPKILRIQPTEILPREDVDGAISELVDLAVRMDDEGIRTRLRRIVPEYVPYSRPSVTSVLVGEDS